MTSSTAILRSSRELCPLVRTISSYIKDMHHRLPDEGAVHNQCTQQHPVQSHPGRLKYSSLYTNIPRPHEEGIAACAEALNTRETQSPPTADLVELISKILNKNAFVFGGTTLPPSPRHSNGYKDGSRLCQPFISQLERN